MRIRSVRTGAVISAMLIVIGGCGSPAAQKTLGVGTSGTVGPAMPETLDAPVALHDGKWHLVPAEAGDATSITQEQALTKFSAFAPPETLDSQPKVFLARFTDDIESASYSANNDSAANFPLPDLKNVLVVAIVAHGTPPLLHGGVTNPPGAKATLILTLDATTGDIVTSAAFSPDTLPPISASPAAG